VGAFARKNSRNITKTTIKLVYHNFEMNYYYFASFNKQASVLQVAN